MSSDCQQWRIPSQARAAHRQLVFPLTINTRRYLTSITGTWGSGHGIDTFDQP